MIGSMVLRRRTATQSLRRRVGIRFSMCSSSFADETDILIVGGGVTGAALARALACRFSFLNIRLLEASNGPAVVESDIPHPRSYALSPSSLRFLGLDKEEGNHSIRKRLGFYKSMQVWEAGQPATLLFTEQDLPPTSSYLGVVAEDSALLHYLWDDLKTRSNVSLETNQRLTSIDLPSSSSTGLAKVSSKNSETSKEEHYKANLLVAADGGNSWVRNTLGVAMNGLSYDGQAALTCTVRLHESFHQGRRAFQRFTADGPIALLPTFSDGHAIIVWSTTTSNRDKWWNADSPNESALIQHLNDLLGKGPERLEPLFSRGDGSSVPGPLNNLLYGMDKVMEMVQYGPTLAAQQYQGAFVSPPTIAELASPVMSFPLSCKQVETYTLPRLALVGDAAHSVHPLAGQGLNIGLADAQALLETIDRAVPAGMDPATFLDEYNRECRARVSTALSGIHALHQIFGLQDPTFVKHAKGLGMNMVQSVGPLRRKLVEAACGL